MTRTYTGFYVSHLTPEQHKQTCNYWYTVTCQATAHTAFTTREGLDRWLAERGLAIVGNFPPADWWCSPVLGTYRERSYLHDADEFYKLQGDRTRTLSNGDYVEAIITTDADGIKTVHTLNPNVKDRKVFDYAESSAMMR